MNFLLKVAIYVKGNISSCEQNITEKNSSKDKWEYCDVIPLLTL